MTTLLMSAHAIHAPLGRVRVCSLCMSSPWCGLNLNPARWAGPLGAPAETGHGHRTDQLDGDVVICRLGTRLPQPKTREQSLRQ